MRIALLVLAAALAVPGAAHGAMVEAAGGTVTVVRYEAAPGEQNRLAVTLELGSAVFSDTGATIRPGPGCQTLADARVRCAWDGVADFVADLADGDDVAAIMSGERSAVLDRWVEAGPGDDRVEGSSRNDRLDGGGGRDLLAGGGGTDLLVDGDQESGAIDGDVLDGGAGNDRVSYGDRTRPVRVTLGEAGGEDALRDVENLTGGQGPDVLVGDAGRNKLDGGPGADRLRGARGSDALTGGLGRDRLEGGPGRDSFDAQELDEFSTPKPAQADAIRCGPGPDHVLYTDAMDTLAADCERAHRLPASPALNSARTRAAFRGFRCFRIGNDRSSRCRATVRLFDRRGRLVASGRGSLRTRPFRRIRSATASFDVPLRITRHGRRALRRRGALLLHASVGYAARIPGLGSSRESARYKVVLRPRP